MFKSPSSSCRRRGPKTTMKMIALMTLLGIILETESTYTDVYNFPMFGVLMYETVGGSKTAYGSITIVHRQVALCAAENLFQKDPTNTEYITNKRRRRNLYIYAGSDLLHPPSWYEPDKVKKAGISDIYVGKSAEWVDKMSQLTISHLGYFVEINGVFAGKIFQRGDLRYADLSASLGLEYKLNPFHELQWEVAVLILAEPLTWSPYILPIQNFFWQPTEVLYDFEYGWNVIEALELNPHNYRPCTVPGWSPIGNNEIIYHRVAYVRFKECAEAICGAYPSTCLKYLHPRMHLCFKAMSFADSCVLDQGAPVICDWYNNHVIGILVRTFECGAETLPSVFVRIGVVETFAAIAEVPKTYAILREPGLHDNRYTLPPNI